LNSGHVSKHTVSADVISKIPFITRPPKDGRALIILPFYAHETKEWVKYLVSISGDLLPIKVIDLIEGLYISETPINPVKDYYYFLATFVFQHLSFPRVSQRLLEQAKTVHYFASWLEIYSRLSADIKDNNDSLLIEAELDRLLMLIRRFYDQVQKVIKEASALVKDVKNTQLSLIKGLPDSFVKMVEHNNSLLTSEEISNKWGLPKSIADMYVAEAEHFIVIRSARVALEHHGKSIGIVVRHQDGYAIGISNDLWKKLPIWNESTTRPNELGSVTAVAGYLISNALDLGFRFVKAYWSCIGTPLAIADGVHCYLRNPYSHHLNNLELMITDPWAIRSQAFKNPNTENRS